MKNKVYNVGIYTRLSQDDERKGESLSIENQKNILTRHAREQGWNIHSTYIDDGYSGTNFERPAFQQMLNDIKNGEINLVLVKDLSRLGRNHVQVGHFIEDILPAFRCRFVALNNNVDTGELNNSSNDMMGLVNLFNEFHSRETSKKVKTVIKSCAERGMFLGSIVPFGYKKSLKDRHKLVSDEETAPIVQRMFKLRCRGDSYRSIALLFNEEHITSPRKLYYQRIGKINPLKQNGMWSHGTVRKMLLSEVYIGHMVQGKCGTISYKSRKIIQKDEEDWIRVENTHEPLISNEIWNQVCALDKNSYRTRKTKTGEKVSIFTGLMVCADCGFKMRSKTVKGIRKNGLEYKYVSFSCGNYSRSGKIACTVHTINENVLNKIVLEEIKTIANDVIYDEGNIIQKILKAKSKETADKAIFYQRELQNNENRLAQLEVLVEELYVDRCEKIISEEMFIRLMKKYDNELQSNTLSNRELTSILKSYEKKVCNASKWAKTIRKYAKLESLEQEILLELIDKIEISEATKIDGKRVCSLKIIYRMVGDINNLESEVSTCEESPEQAI